MALSPKEPSARQEYLSTRKEDLIDVMTDGSPTIIAELIEKNPWRMGRFLKRLDREFDREQFTQALRSNNKEAHNFCRNYIRNCLNEHAHKLPQYLLRKPDDYKDFLKERALKKDRDIIIMSLSKSAGKALRGNIPSGLNLPVQGVALGLNMLGINRTQRNVGGLIFGAAAITSTFMSMSVTINDAEASIPPATNATVLSQTDLATPPPTGGSTLAYNVTQQFGNMTQFVSKTMDEPTDKTPVINSPYLLSPYLLKKLQTEPQAREYTQWCFDVAKRHNLDPVLFTNQIFRESMHFNADVISGEKVSDKGAIGIAQFIPSTAKIYGLTKEELTSNPQKALEGAAAMMAAKTAKYGGDQLLALAAYNGGDGAVTWVQDKLGRKNITSQDWLTFMEKRRTAHPTTKAHAYQNETYAYIMDISNKGWDTQYASWAKRLMHQELPLTVASTLGIRSIGPTDEKLSLNLPTGREIPIPRAAPRRPQNG